MGLNALLARLEARSVTSVTNAIAHDVIEKPNQIKACTVVTSVTSTNNSFVADIPVIPCAWDANDWQAFFDERAAIAEYDGRLLRADAEMLARQTGVKTHDL